MTKNAPIFPTMPQVQNQNLSADYVNLGGARFNKISSQEEYCSPEPIALLSASCGRRGFLLHQFKFKKL